MEAWGVVVLCVFRIATRNFILQSLHLNVNDGCFCLNDDGYYYGLIYFLSHVERVILTTQLKPLKPLFNLNDTSI